MACGAFVSSALTARAVQLPDEALEAPGSPLDLYLASSPAEVDQARLFMTGDVFGEVTIPGVTPDTAPDNARLGIVLTHPCSMRVDGVRLAPRLHMARVVTSQEIPLRKWRDGHFKAMPLPELAGEHRTARFEDMGLVESASLLPERRIACLSPYGIHLLQQRFIWYLTRFLVPTHRLAEATAAVFEEAELEEEWVSRAAERGTARHTSVEAFHQWIRSSDQSGSTRQEQLADPQRRAGIRRAMRLHLAHG